jgi:D-lactate dehydrogenase (cytochrome)
MDRLVEPGRFADEQERAALIARLGARFGPRLSTALSVREQHGRGEAGYRPQPPDAVVFAETSEEVAAIVAACAAARMPVIAHGAGSSLEGHVAAVHGGVSIDLTGMNRILSVETEDLTCTVEAGVTREALNAYLRDQGLFFPIDPGANATLGGMAATRASGTNAVRYGTMRTNVLAATVVTAEGRVLRTARRARKTAAGYDLTGLFVGSEGTLGIMTELTLRLYGIPERIDAAVCGFARLEDAVSAVIAVIQIGVPIARIELLDEVQVRACNAYSKTRFAERPTLFLEFHGSAASVASDVATVAEILSSFGGEDLEWAQAQEDRSRLWKARHDAYHAAKALRPGADIIVTDVCVPISALAACILETRADIDAAGLTAPIVGHVGDGNFHVMALTDPNDPAEVEALHAFNDRLVARALAMDGTSTGEHGIGLGKRDKLIDELGEDAVDTMRRIKRALDPAGILNPDKIFRPT